MKIAVASLACLLALSPLGGAAFANDAVALALDRPATITHRAASGLFTAVTSAGGRLVAVGERGRIMLSDDSGLSWRQVASPTSVTLTTCSARSSSAASGRWKM